MEQHERSGVERAVPIAAWPDAPAVMAWRERLEPPAVTYRCGRGARRCQRLAFVFETEHDLGAVVVFHQSTTSRPVPIAPDIASHPALIAELAERYKFEPGSDQALTRERKDVAGTVVAVERDDRWHNVVTVACTKHVGTTKIRREQILADLARARETGGCVEVTLEP